MARPIINLPSSSSNKMGWCQPILTRSIQTTIMNRIIVSLCEKLDGTVDTKKDYENVSYIFKLHIKKLTGNIHHLDRNVVKNSYFT